jgi:hypothetical protein
MAGVGYALAGGVGAAALPWVDPEEGWGTLTITGHSRSDHRVGGGTRRWVDPALSRLRAMTCWRQPLPGLGGPNLSQLRLEDPNSAGM